MKKVDDYKALKKKEQSLKRSLSKVTEQLTAIESIYNEMSVGDAAEIVRKAVWEFHNLSRITTNDAQMVELAKVNEGLLEEALKNIVDWEDLMIECVMECKKPYILININDYAPDPTDIIEHTELQDELIDLFDFLHLKSFVKDSKLKIKLSRPAYAKFDALFSNLINRLSETRLNIGALDHL